MVRANGDGKQVRSGYRQGTREQSTNSWAAGLTLVNSQRGQGKIKRGEAGSDSGAISQFTELGTKLNDSAILLQMGWGRAV